MAVERSGRVIAARMVLSASDGVSHGFAGSNPVKFMRAYADLGLKAKIPLLAVGRNGRCGCVTPAPSVEGRLQYRSTVHLGEEFPACLRVSQVRERLH